MLLQVAAGPLLEPPRAADFMQEVTDGIVPITRYQLVEPAENVPPLPITPVCARCRYPCPHRLNLLEQRGDVFAHVFHAWQSSAVS